MLELLPDREDHLSLPPSDLLSLEEAGIRGGAFAMRTLNAAHLERLSLSDPSRWPDVLVTRSTRGYVLIDGYHRREDARLRPLAHLLATCRPFAHDNEVVEAAFRANLRHGLPASAENRSDYAFWLHVTYPEMEQEEIARRVGVTQSTVSKAIARREADLHRARQEEDGAPDEQSRAGHLQKSCRSFTRFALRFLGEVDKLDDADLMQMLQASVKKREDRTKLARIGRLLNSESSLRLRPFPPSQPTQEVPALPTDWAQ